VLVGVSMIKSVVGSFLLFTRVHQVPLYDFHGVSLALCVAGVATDSLNPRTTHVLVR